MARHLDIDQLAINTIRCLNRPDFRKSGATVIKFAVQAPLL
jgi:hypothetical protein